MTYTKHPMTRALPLLALCLATGVAGAANDALRITGRVATSVTISQASGDSAAFTVDSNAPTTFTLVYYDLSTFANQPRRLIEVVAR